MLALLWLAERGPQPFEHLGFPRRAWSGERKIRLEVLTRQSRSFATIWLGAGGCGSKVDTPQQRATLRALLRRRDRQNGAHARIDIPIPERFL